MTNPQSIAAQLHQLTDLDQAAALLAPLTGTQLAQVAAAHQPRIWLTRRTVDQRRAELLHWTVQRRLDCAAVAGIR